MLTIEPAALVALAAQLAKVDAAFQLQSDAFDSLEVAAAKTDNEPARLACLQTLRAATEEYDGELIDLAEDVRVALYGENDDEG
jgi:hypothetical protein